MLPISLNIGILCIEGMLPFCYTVYKIIWNTLPFQFSRKHGLTIMLDMDRVISKFPWISIIMSQKDLKYDDDNFLIQYIS